MISFNMMNRILTAAAALMLLSACASDRFYPAETGDGRYYLGDYPSSAVHHRAAYSPLFAYGVYPWWGYTYYSPYFYPHFFSVRYTPWPYYYAWPGTYYGYADWAYGYLPYRRHRHYHPGYHPGVSLPVAPSPGIPVPPVGLPGGARERMRMLDDRSLQREMRYGSMPAAQRGISGSASRPGTPAASIGSRSSGAVRGMNPGFSGMRSGASIGSSPATSGRSGPGPVSRRAPGLRDQ
jgi:hypothetical protein